MVESAGEGRREFPRKKVKSVHSGSQNITHQFPQRYIPSVEFTPISAGFAQLPHVATEKSGSNTSTHHTESHRY